MCRHISSEKNVPEEVLIPRILVFEVTLYSTFFLLLQNNTATHPNLSSSLFNARPANHQVVPGDLPLLQLISGQSSSVPLEKVAALEGGIHSIILH